MNNKEKIKLIHSYNIIFGNEEHKNKNKKL